ncbi:hypothetical protein COLO4_09077 [Corchorus olitorius]|uniref:F-box domain-containing protein n=1 Tax=Corchorus olitorius TaxID=93759 RepID=A0A1R3KD97_9ROSI|nr:hypothetical protein COLO4_09077 [Corchorus olitorius]
MAKRPCPSSSQNPRLPPHFSQMDHLLHSFLSLADSSPQISLDLSFDRLLESSPSDADQSLLIDRAHKLGSLLLRAANRSARKRASLHNSIAWALPPDLTIKVFSMLDSQSLCYAAATCSMFNKCAMDPLCYANIDLTTVVPKVNNAVVSTMIQRAGKSLQSLKLGIVPGPTASPGRDDSLKSPTCVELVNNCPNLSSLSLRGFKLHDYKVRILVKGFRKLKYADFSTSYSITGTFLRNLGSGGCGNPLEVEVARFLTSVLAGDFKSLRHFDISNREGLASEGDWYQRSYNSSIIPLKQVLEVRPNICLLAEFPSEGSFIDLDQMIDSDVNSEVSMPSQLSSHTSDGSLLMSSSESSYNSDQGSGNEEYQESDSRKEGLSQSDKLSSREAEKLSFEQQYLVVILIYYYNPMLLALSYYVGGALSSASLRLLS